MTDKNVVCRPYPIQVKSIWIWHLDRNFVADLELFLDIVDPLITQLRYMNEPLLCIYVCIRWFLVHMEDRMGM